MMQKPDMDKFLFLDIDGVLCNHNMECYTKKMEDKRADFDRDCVKQLGRIIDHTGAYIVLSSVWRIGLELEDIQRIFYLRGFSVSKQIIGKTDKFFYARSGEKVDKLSTNWHSAPRGIEIKEWLEGHLIDFYNRKYGVDYTYCIVDDDEDMLYEQRNNFVKCDEVPGLTKENADEIIRILNNNEPPKIKGHIKSVRKFQPKPVIDKDLLDDDFLDNL